MRLAAAAAVALAAGLAVAGCHPTVRGRCASDTDCRAGSSCSVDGLCVNLTPPDVQVVLAPGDILSPASPRVRVRVSADAQLQLGSLSVTAVSGKTLASGSIAAAVDGDNFVTLTQFQPDAVGQVSVTATVRYATPGVAQRTVASEPALALLDAQPSSLHPFVPATSDMVNGWVPRTSGTLEVQAQVDDGIGSGPASATLTLDHCPPSAPCTYPGIVIARPSAATATFSFQVPRAVQAAGSEAPITAVVAALDQAQNTARRSVTLQIDDAPPAIGAVRLVSTGVAGEDGRTWFPGGPGAPPVEIAVTATDAGSGVASLALHLGAGAPAGTADPQGTANADGSFHFLLPAASIVGTEGPLSFSLVAQDRLQKASTVPASAATSVYIDDAPPAISNVTVAYLAPSADVCAPGVICGRGPASAPDHYLPDDVATVEFDAVDCGSGLTAAPAVNAVSASAGATAAGCSNPKHHYSVQLDLTTQKPGDPVAGERRLPLTVTGADALGHPATNTDAVALISIVRWRAQLQPAIGPSGAPALQPAAASGAPRKLVVSTAAVAPNANLFVLNAEGGQEIAAKAARISQDPAVDANGVIYAVGFDPGTGASTLSILDPATSTTPLSCALSGTTIGSPPVIEGFPAKPLAVLAASSTGVDNVFVYGSKSGCTAVDAEALVLSAQTTFTGVSARDNTLFFAHGAGFSSIAFDGSTFVQSSVSSFSATGGGGAGARGAPAIAASPEAACFAGTDKKVRQTLPATCSGVPCWTPSVTEPAPSGIGNLNGTPVFDASFIYATDANGIVYVFQQGASRLQAQISAAPSGTAASSPVLVGAGQALVVQQDATVRLVTPATASAVTLLQMKTPANAPASYSGAPPTPVVDVRGSGGVAYIPDGAGQVWAVQLDQAPVPASAQVWPRPGRDSCNSRNASASYCP